MKLFEHVKLILLLSILAILLLVLSFYTSDDSKLFGILQGLATGILSGMIVLLINGIKNRQQQELSKNLKSLQQCNKALSNITHAYSSVLHETYHGKNNEMSFTEYYSKVYESHRKYLEAYDILKNIDQMCISNELRNNVVDCLDSTLCCTTDVSSKLSEAIAKNSINPLDGKTELTEARDMLYNVSNKAFLLYPKTLELEVDINSELSQLNTLFI